MKAEENVIDQRSMELVSRIIRMVDHLPKDSTAEIMGKAVVRSAAAAGIHYTDASKARSAREFLRDMRLMQAQLSQTDFWLKLIEGSSFFPKEKISSLKNSNAELLRMVGKSIKTANDNLKKAAAEKKAQKEKAIAAAARQKAV